MSMLLLSLDGLSEAQLAWVRAAAGDMEILVSQDRDEIEAVLDRVEIVAGFIPHDLLVQARNLRWLQQWGAGADWLLRHPEAAELDFVLTNVSGVHAVPISEHILAFLLAFARGIHHAVRAQVRGEWIPPSQRGNVFELAGKTMVLIGVGSIGERTAALSAAFGMRVWGVRRNPAVGAPGVTAMFGPYQLLDLLPEADFVVLTVPHTRETHQMIGERELRAMRSSAIIVNTGRGGWIQQAALIRALGEGWIAGAGLDVFEDEPLAAGSPLLKMGHQILLSPHMVASNLSSGLLRQGVECANRAVVAALNGEIPEHVYNKAVIPSWLKRFGGQRLV